MRWIILIFLPLFAVAETCSPVNYLTSKNSPFEKIPVGDQDGTGICYAFSTSQLLDYYLLKSGQTSERTMHPAWVALKGSRRILYSGFEGETINAVRAAGTCAYDRVEETINAFAAGSNLAGIPLVNFIESYAISSSRYTGAPEYKSEDTFWAAVSATAPFCDENVLWESLQPKLQELTGTSVQIFNRLLSQGCDSPNIHRYKIPAPKSEVIVDDGRAVTLQNSLVARGPYTISYCGTTWTAGPEYAGIGRPSNNMLEDCGPHSSLVVGRKKIQGICHSLVRNSWGNGWGDWNSNSYCICRHKLTGAWVDECNVYDHSPEDYSVEACYIDQRQLARNLQGVTSL